VESLHVSHVERMDIKPLTVQTGNQTEEKLTSLKRRGMMLSHEDADSGRSLGMHKILLTPEKEVESCSERGADCLG
jgi:hypothetical protein